MGRDLTALSARLRALLSGLGALDVTQTGQGALLESAAKLADTVRERLSTAPGGEHDTPWACSGQLRDSIGLAVDGARVLVGSTDPVAVWQEAGTARVPPRPFLAPAARDAASDIARTVGEAVSDALTKATR